MEDIIELKLDHPIKCSLRCINDPEAIREAEKYIVQYAWWLYKKSLNGKSIVNYDISTSY